MTERWVAIDGLCNARDLGGVRLADGRRTAFGVVLRSETLVHLTCEGLVQLREREVRHVIDLREPGERDLDGDGLLEGDYQRSGIVHENVPLSGVSVEHDTVGRVGAADVVAERYCDYLRTGGFRLAEALARSAWSSSATLVHCAVGKDRTGVVSALLLKLAGADDEAVVEDHLLSSERIVPVISRLGTRPAYAHLADPDWSAQAPSAEAMRLFLGHLASLGGARQWLLAHGSDPETVDLLQSRLLGEQFAVLRAV